MGSRSVQEILTIPQDKNWCRHCYEHAVGNTKMFSNLRWCWGHHRWGDSADKCERRQDNGGSPFLAVWPARLCCRVIANLTKRGDTTHFFGFIGSAGPSQSTHNTLASDIRVSSLTFFGLVWDNPALDINMVWYGVERLKLDTNLLRLLYIKREQSMMTKIHYQYWYSRDGECNAADSYGVYK